MRKSAVVAHFGSQRAVAEKLEITEQAVSQWDEIIPEGMAYKVESITRRKLRVDSAVYRRLRRGSSIGAR